jgi:hypothetical protein
MALQAWRSATPALRLRRPQQRTRRPRQCRRAWASDADLGLRSSASCGGPCVETQKDRAKTHFWVLPQLRRKMGHGFASSVEVRFIPQKHCIQRIFGFGSRYASAVGVRLRS